MLPLGVVRDSTAPVEQRTPRRDAGSHETGRSRWPSSTRC